MNRLFRIFGTCWIISAAMAQEGADSRLITIDQKNQKTIHATRVPMNEHPFHQFLQEFIPPVEIKSKDLNLAVWILETTGSDDAAVLKADLDAELRYAFHDPVVYKKLVDWEREGKIADPILKRELNILVRSFKQNQIPKELLTQMAQKESMLAQSYANFRPLLDGKEVSENEIRDLMKSEKVPAKRKAIWEASKKIGPLLAPQILELVRLRNEAAHSMGYSDYFQMQLELQEVDPKWLLKTLDDLGAKSDKAYGNMVHSIENAQIDRFGVTIEELGPWAWSEPFAQEDPLDSAELDGLVQGVDIPKAAAKFYAEMGINVDSILQKSDLYERPGKNQHAFCINIDRKLDIRTLDNIQPTIKWLETLLHELGHGVYELGFDPSLPWLLREPPHMITTEAMALLAGRQAYRYQTLKTLIGGSHGQETLLRSVDESLKRRQLIFSRWVLVMTAFESEMYRDPSQDLNTLWWSLVEKYQKIRAPKNRKGQMDWACKYHIGLAPVYYFSYLLGEMFASAIQESLVKVAGTHMLTTPAVGKFLNEKLFSPGDRMAWSELIRYVTGKPLNPDAWIREFATE